MNRDDIQIPEPRTLLHYGTVIFVLGMYVLTFVVCILAAVVWFT